LYASCVLGLHLSALFLFIQHYLSKKKRKGNVSMRYLIEVSPVLYDINGFVLISLAIFDNQWYLLVFLGCQAGHFFDKVNRLSALPKQMHELDNYYFRKYLLAFGME
jgi:hypothetical protein